VDKITLGLDLADDQLTLVGADTRVGFPAQLDWRNTSSLGHQLVNVLAMQVRGTLELDKSAGSAWKLTFPYPVSRGE
jgi:two-component sensor histidine kinase